MLPQPSLQQLASILQKCRKEDAQAGALRLHSYLYKCALEADKLLGKHLVSMLVEARCTHNAHQVSDDFRSQKACSWDALITGCIKCGLLEHALILYERMQEEKCGFPSAYTCIALLRACATQNNRIRGLKINAAMVSLGLLEADPFIVSSLLNMYLAFDWIIEAEKVLTNLPDQNVVSWTALISWYVKHGHGEEALCCFAKMQLAGVFPDAVTFISSLRACILIGVYDKGQEIHAEIERRGLLETSLALGNALVDMYAKCGSVAKAQEVFDLLPSRDVASWTSLLAGYAEEGHGEEALRIFGQMQQSRIPPNDLTFVCILKACGGLKAADKGQQLHTDIEGKNLLEGNIIIGNALVDMYGKCGLLAEAQHLFDKFVVRDVVSWNVLIGGYAEHGHGKEALHWFEQMQIYGVPANAFTFALALKACVSVGAIDVGLELHAEIARKGSMEEDMVVGSTLVDMYLQCGSLAKAQEVFDKLLVRNSFTWETLISGCVEYGHGDAALKYVDQMQSLGVHPNASTIVCCLKACVSIGALYKSEEFHSEIESTGLVESDLVVGTALVDIYAKQGLLAKAQHVFDKLQIQNAITWNSLIAGYAEHERAMEALKCFEQMHLEGVFPNVVTFVYALKACGHIREINKGSEIHAEVLRKDFLGRSLHLGSSLVDMYAKCGSLVRAREVFEKLPFQNVVTWNALITGYVEHGLGEQAIEYFEKMQAAGVSQDVVTFVCTLKACGTIGATDKGQDIHTEVSKKGLLKEDSIGNALVDMYAKCGMLVKAREVFDNVLSHSVVTWNSMIAGYVEHGQDEDALECFAHMMLEGAIPNSVSFIFVLKACGNVGAIDKGKEIHVEIERKGLFEMDLVGAALVNMYGKCGLLAMAQQVFDKLPTRSIVSWNLLIAGYAQQGESEMVFDFFWKMIDEDIKPDCVTFVVVLNVCSQIGLYGEIQTYFDAMSKDYGITPTLEHHTCIIDLLGRTGELDKVTAMIKQLPICPDLVVWRSVLDACMKWGHEDIGRCAFEQAVHLDEEDAAAYVWMSNIYRGASSKEEGNRQ